MILVDSNNLNNGACIKYIFEGTSASKLPFKVRDIIGAYVTLVDNTLACALQEGQRALLKAHA